MRRIIQLIVSSLCCLSSPTLLAQLPIDLFGPSQVEPLHQLDTLYYPLRDGLQMIVIDHIAYWDRKIYFLEQSQPRAIPHSAYLPMPFGNEYFFRDASGEIVKAYNSPYSLETLNAHFAKIPIDKENDSGRLLTHQDSINTKGVWAYSPNPMFYFRGFYKVFEPLADNPKQATFGLIDSMGKLVIPIQYQEIWPLGELLLVKRNDKWGVINRVNKIIVPLRYDEIDNYYADGLSDNIFFLKQGKFAAVFLPNEQKTIKLNDYDKIFDKHKKHGQYAGRVVKEGKIGAINVSFEEFIAPEYDRLNPCGDRGGYLTQIGNRYGFLDSAGQTILAVQYESVDLCYHHDRLLVEQGNRYGFADPQGEIIIPFSYMYASPFYYKTAFVRIDNQTMGIIDLNGHIVATFADADNMGHLSGGYYYISMGGKAGLVDYLGKEVIPCQYDRIVKNGYPRNPEIRLLLNGVEELRSLELLEDYQER